MKTSNSAIAGTFGAFASVFGKLSSDTAFITTVVPTNATIFCISTFCITVYTVYHGICLAIMLAMNSIMLHFFVLGLRSTDTLTATITSTCSNFIVSAVLGWSIFGEHLSLQWWFGASLMLLGMKYIKAVDNTKKSE